MDVPPDKSAKDIKGSSTYRPDQLDAELAAAAMANDMVNRLGTPSIVSKKFVVYQGIWQGLNHTVENQTGYDSSLRIAIYNKVAGQSVNVDGKYFDSFWTFMNKPKFIMSGMMQPGEFEKEQPSMLERIGDFIRGKKREEPK